MNLSIYQTIFLTEAAAASESLLSFKHLINQYLPDVLDFIKGLLIAILVIIIGKKLIKIFLHILDRYFERSKMEASVTGFLIAFIKSILYVILIITAVSFIGIKSGSIVALVGSAGLTLGLALQGSLSNFAGGVLILILKPFRVGDYIMSGNYEGTVTTIDIFYTRLLTFDNKLLVMPNGALSNGNIINVSNEANRRLDLVIPVDYSADIQKVKDILKSIVSQNERVLKDQDIMIFVNNLDQGAVSMGIRVWVANSDYWMLKWELLEQIKQDFDQNQISIPLNQFKADFKINGLEATKK